MRNKDYGKHNARRRRKFKKIKSNAEIYNRRDAQRQAREG